MTVYLLIEVTDMSDFHDDQYNLSPEQERVLGVYFCEDEAEKDKGFYEKKTIEYAEEFGCDISTYEIREYPVK